MYDQLDSLLTELNQLKAEGVTTVYCEEDTLQALKDSFPKPTEPQIVEEPAPALTKKDPPAKVTPKNASKASTPAKPKLIPPTVEIPQGDKQSQWEWLRETVLNCKVCKDHVNSGSKVTFGIGNINADVLFCGEAPDIEDEVQGEPFIGKSGQLLTKIINAMGLSREDVYLTNIMNWRPEMSTPFGNRPPTQEEMNFCLPYLKAQIDIIKPKVIVALGATAVTGLLGADSKRRMGDIRGNWHDLNNTPLMITFHPSYLIRNNTMRTKRLVWEDMLKIMEKINLPISEKQRGFFK